MTKLTVVYDDGCPTCTVGKNFSESLDRNKSVAFVGMNTPEGKALVERHRLDMRDSAYALHEDGSFSDKAHMVRDVLAHNGVIGFLCSLPFRLPIIGDGLYAFLARHRRHTTKSHID